MVRGLTSPLVKPERAAAVEVEQPLDVAPEEQRRGGSLGLGRRDRHESEHVALLLRQADDEAAVDEAFFGLLGVVRRVFARRVGQGVPLGAPLVALDGPSWTRF